MSNSKRIKTENVKFPVSYRKTVHEIFKEAKSIA